MYVIFADYFEFLSINKFKQEVPYSIKFDNNKLYIAKYNFNNEQNSDIIPFTQPEISDILQKCQNHIADAEPYVYYKNMELSLSDKITILSNKTNITSIDEYGNHKYFYCNSKTDIIQYLNNYIPSLLQVSNSNSIYAEYNSDSETSIKLQVRDEFYKIPFEKKISSVNTVLLNNNTFKFIGLTNTDFLCSFNCNLSISSNSDVITLAFFKNSNMVFKTLFKITNGSNTINLVNMKKLISFAPLDELDIRISNNSNSNKVITIFNSVFSINT